MADSDSDYEPEPRPAIWDAIHAFDAEALRRELAAGVDLNVSHEHGQTPFLLALVLFRAARRPAERIHERLACLRCCWRPALALSLPMVPIPKE